ncbi:hypothetical protein AJ80_08348 [Polytolypa hystricis UAMH7299]|uniref:Inosine/uridine-preferring nucleoside hydrolase domain-containing protein n=1 Tax=Polytolypa hystricis (strain UAMH7299) TaxID=1447883 RepID=A0A2B7X936_POLH7|nr:hypothetical protein AJ80_08348 [Polytolypa hystricis UAMH7299]
MGPVSRVIIDTDPGVDDILALLLALSATAGEIEVLLISLTFGNIQVRSCLRNVVSMFHIIERELEWRRQRGQTERFEALKAFRPTIAVGADQPLDDEMMLADYFHGLDGLGDVHSTHPHLTPEETWESVFFPSAGPAVEPAPSAQHASFIVSTKPAHQEILRILRENDPGTITIVAVGPLTNLALAAAEDAETFLQAKEVVVMGGVVDRPGNVTPLAEFNTFADALASARVFALTSPKPSSTMPPTNLATPSALPAYPEGLSKKLTLKLFPLDITTSHNLTRGQFRTRVAPIAATGSPLAEWLSAILAHSFGKLDALHPGHEGDRAALSLHDPLCIWYALTPTSPAWTASADSPVDIRVETTGQWTRGMCVVDRRDRKRRDDDGPDSSDHGHWLSDKRGNRIWKMAGSPGCDLFGEFLLDRLFG